MDFNKVKIKYPYVDNISCDTLGNGFYCIVSVKKEITPQIEDKKKISNMIWESLYDHGNRIPIHNIKISFVKR